MTFIVGLLGVVAVLSSVLLMFVVLLQEPKGGGLAAALGGSGMDAIGANVGQVNRFTSWVAGIWIGACLLHAVLQPVGANIAAAAGTGSDGSGPAVDAPPEKPADEPADPPK
jgi:preprotein translocase subunit SecG